MYIKLLISIILGYVRISVEGYYIERFLNICRNKKIFIWNLKRNNSSKLYLNVGIKNFKKITKIARKTNCITKIIGKRGIPFLLHKYKKRKIFCILLLVVFIAILVSSNFIWNIDIKINDEQQLENIEKDLENLGLKCGIRKNQIDVNYIINNLRLTRNDIAWVRD